MKHVFIINPIAGKQKAVKKFLPGLVSYLNKHDELDYEIHRTLNKPEIRTYVKQVASKGQPVRFYSCGGDGTLCDVLNGMIGYDNAELAMVPCGTGNDFARIFKPFSYLTDYDRLINGTAIPADCIKYGDTYALNMLNIGADCDIVAESANFKTFGSFSYAAATLKVLLDDRRYPMSYDIDGECGDEDFWLCAIGNGKFCGGGFMSCTNAHINDGLLDVALVRPVKGVKLFPLLLKYRKGTYLEDSSAKEYFIYRKCKSITLTPHRNVNVSIDGEIEAFTSSTIEVVPGAVKIVLPRGVSFID